MVVVVVRVGEVVLVVTAGLEEVVDVVVVVVAAAEELEREKAALETGRELDEELDVVDAARTLGGELLEAALDEELEDDMAIDELESGIDELDAAIDDEEVLIIAIGELELDIIMLEDDR